MRNRALIIELVKVVAVVALATAGLGCGSPQKNRIPADVSALEYQAPDVEEIAGTEDDDEPEEQVEPGTAPAQNPQ